MKRPLQAAAIAAAALSIASSAASAQSVSVYGVLDANVGQFQESGQTKTTRVDSGDMDTSFIGFSGSEAVSGTLKAKFALESFMLVNNGQAGRFGGDAFWARSAWVGLQGDFGSTSLGRTTNQFFVSTLIFNPFSASFGFSPSILQVLIPSVAHPQMLPWFGDTGWSNSLLYSSPDHGGLSFNLQANLGEGGSAAGSYGNNLGANVLYFHGPLAATVALQQVKNGVFGAPAGFESQTSFQLGGSYDLNVVKLFGQFSQVKTAASVDTKTTIYGIGASAPLGKGKLLAEFGDAKADFGGASADLTNQTLTLGYDYSLSKKTDVYGIVMSDKLTNLATGTSWAAGIRMYF